MLKKNSGSGTPRTILCNRRTILCTRPAMVAVSLAAIAGNRVGCLGHARGQPTKLKKLFARAQVDLHLQPVDA